MKTNKTLNILFTSTYFYPYLSGLSEYPLQIARHWSSEHKISVLTFQYQKDLVLFENYKKIDIHRVPVHLKISKGLWNFFYPVIAFFYVKKANKIFINLPQFEGFWPALWGKILGKQVFSIYHCELSFDQGFLTRILAHMANLSALLSCLLSNKIITYTKDYAKSSKILALFPKKLKFVLPPVKKQSLSKKYMQFLSKKCEGGGPIIGFSGRVAREKGLEYLLRSLVTLQKDYPKLIFLIAGPYQKQVVGESEYYNKLRKIISKNKLKVFFLGLLNKHDLASFYKYIDILVLPSINKTEAFGMVQAEAMLMGTPVISTRLPGVRIPILLTKMGELVAIKDSKDLVVKIKKIIKNKPFYTKNTIKTHKIFDIKNTYIFYDSLL